MHDDNELMRISFIKKSVKQVNELSRKIYLTGLNAMLMTRRAGGAGTGFSRVTTELRAFSEQLERAMSNLVIDGEKITFDVSYNVQQRRIGDLFREALRQSEERQGKRLFSHSIEQQESSNEFEDMARAINHLSTLCRMGQNIAVLAKVEAMHVGAFSDVLLKIGDEVSVHVDCIETTLTSAYETASGQRIAA